MKTSIITSTVIIGLLAMRTGLAAAGNDASSQGIGGGKESVEFSGVREATHALVAENIAPIRMTPLYVRAGMPTPIHILEPRIGTEFAGQEVELKFTVDKSGRAYGIDAVNPMVDRSLVTQLASAIQGWQFDPARDLEGNPFEREMTLPVVIVEQLFNSDEESATEESGTAVNSQPDVPTQMAPYHVRTDFSFPAPVNIVTPRLSPDFENQNLELRFTVDKAGRPYNIDATNPAADRNLVTQLSSAIWFWRFDPARDSTGNPVERNVILPVVIGPATVR